MKNLEILLYSISLCFLVSSGFEIEKCASLSVPSGANDPQPAIVMFNFTETYTTIELGPETGAKCLDGTNYKFYFTPGQGDGVDKWVFYFQGAAFCGADGTDVLESCLFRLTTQYGTSNSTYWGDNGTNSTAPAAYGWFSSMKEYNPYFWNYNKMELISCDGSNFQGSLDEPLVYNGTKMWFRGFNNVMATLEYLDENYGLLRASEVIIGGGSSGGAAAVIWSSYLQDYFSKSTKLIGLSDAGLFVDTYSKYNGCHLYRYFMQNLVVSLSLNSSNSSKLYRRCKYRDTDLWKCMMPQYVYDTIDIPMFFFNCEHDFKQLTNGQAMGCIFNGDGGLTYCNDTDRAIIAYVREYFLSIALEMKKNKPQWGFWLRTCFEHTLHFTWAWYGNEFNVFSAETQKSSNGKDAYYSWYDNLGDTTTPAVSYIDVIDWLHNPLCHYGPNLYDEANL